MYRDFAYIYDELMDDVDYEAWYQYIMSFIDGDGLMDVLEMACGTGRMTEYLLKDGYSVTSFDLSEDMLAVAYNRLINYNRLRILKANMVDFSHENSYDLVMANCDSINYLVGPGELETCFKNVFLNLRPGGTFIFDLNSPYKLREVLGNNIFIEDREDIFYSWENYLDEDEKIVNFILNFFVKDETGKYVRFDEEHRERIYEIDEVMESLTRQGFEELECFESFSRKSPGPTSERLTFIARKKSL